MSAWTDMPLQSIEGITIREADVYSVRVPRRARWALHRGTIPTHSTFALVKLTTADGVAGWGEATIPMPAVRHLVQDYMVGVVVGSNPFHIERFHREVDRIEMMVMERIGGWNPARAAVDIALYDLMGKYLNVPVWRLLGERHREWIPTVKNVGAGSVEENVQAALEIVARGYQVLKVRVGHDEALEIARISALRDSLGTSVRFRLDANQAWQPKQATGLIRRLEAWGLESVEQPVKRWDIWGARDVVARVSTPIIADEGFWTADEALLLLREQAADVLHLYLSKCGGLYPALRIARLAEQFHVAVTVGERIPLGICEAADAHFAAALPNLEYPCALSYDLNEHDLLTEPIPRQGPLLGVPDGPGLGIVVDEARLGDYLAAEGAAARP